MSRQAVIVCPLRHERNRLRRRLGREVRIECSGPGAPGIERWAVRCGIEPGSTVVLAGVAGGLSERARAGTAWVVTRVVGQGDDAGCCVVDDEARAADATIVCAVTPVVSTDAKRSLHHESRADLVDLESARFAAIACAQRWNWGIVRGVSDDVATALPPGVAGCVDDQGRTRGLRVAASLLRRPTSTPALIHLGRASNRALDAVAARVRELLRTR